MTLFRQFLHLLSLFSLADHVFAHPPRLGRSQSLVALDSYFTNGRTVLKGRQDDGDSTAVQIPLLELEALWDQAEALLLQISVILASAGVVAVPTDLPLPTTFPGGILPTSIAQLTTFPGGVLPPSSSQPTTLPESILPTDPILSVLPTSSDVFQSTDQLPTTTGTAEPPTLPGEHRPSQTKSEPSTLATVQLTSTSLPDTTLTSTTLSPLANPTSFGPEVLASANTTVPPLPTDPPASSVELTREWTLTDDIIVTTVTETDWVTLNGTTIGYSASTFQTVVVTSSSTLPIPTSSSLYSFYNISTSTVSSSQNASSTSLETFPGISTSLTASETVTSIPTNTTRPYIPTYTAPAAPAYTFDPTSESNVAVYYGQTSLTGEYSLESQCADPNIDIVILAFVVSDNYLGSGWPQVNFGAACGGLTPTMEQTAPGLLYCPALASNISSCQRTYGKKVLLSVGGATGQISFGSALEAESFATKLWQLFGPNNGDINSDLRPFGSVVIDGFDVDNEDNMQQYWDAFGVALRTVYASDASKTYYLSSAPQCPYPDYSNPLSLLLLTDFVFVQFYNNPPCEIGSAGFSASLETWSAALVNSTMPNPPRVFVGAPSWSQAGATAYQAIGTPAGIQSIAAQAKALGLNNFGGVMFWDGPEGTANTEDGKSILGYAKAGLA